METNPEPQVSIFKAKPLEERKTVAQQKEPRVTRSTLIPDDLLQNEFLNTLINRSLPKNYNFEIHKTLWKIKQTQAKRVLLQLPEGLIRFGPVLVDIFSGYFSESLGRTDIRFITMGDLTYGACCIDDFLAASLGCDLIVHYAHSCLVPINQLNSDLKYLYIFLDIRFDLEHMIGCVKHNFNPAQHKIALASTIQFVTSAHEVARHLRDLGFTVNLPQSRPLSSGEVLGCTAPRLDPMFNTILFICDGRFHLEALMIANPDIEAYRYDPYSRKLTHEEYAFNEMYTQRMDAIERAAQAMRMGGTLAVILGTLGRQGSEKVFDELVRKCNLYTSCKVIKVMMPEVIQDSLKEFENVDVWIQVACPRLSIDWGSFFHQPLLNPYELAQSIKLLQGDRELQQVAAKAYPMDFYAKNSCGDHTPNHECERNPNCCCMKESTLAQ